MANRNTWTNLSISKMLNHSSSGSAAPGRKKATHERRNQRIPGQKDLSVNLMLYFIGIKFTPPVPQAEDREYGKHKVFKTVELHALDKIKVGRDDIDDNPDDPAFNLLLDHIERRHNAHDHNERIDIRKRAGQREKSWKPFVQATGQRTQHKGSCNANQRDHQKTFPSHIADPQFFLSILFTRLRTSPANPT